MLIISRRENEKFLFPNLGVSVQLVKVAGKVAKIGVEAPDDVRILREELLDESVGFNLPASLTEMAGSTPSELKNEIRDRLSPISLGLQLAQNQIEKGTTENLDSMISKLLAEMKELDRELLGNSNQQDTTNRLANAISSADLDDAKVALVVDDDENERSLLGSLLELSGYAVVVVEDGQAAIDYLNQSFRQPDFVLLDMNMPRKNGVETVAEIRADERFAGLKVFAISGSDREDVGMDVGPGGVDRWFTKPLDTRQLVKEMSESNVA